MILVKSKDQKISMQRTALFLLAICFSIISSDALGMNIKTVQQEKTLPTPGTAKPIIIENETEFTQ